jgi:hypothetical protein
VVHVGTKVGRGGDARIDLGVKSRLGTGIRAVGKACDCDNGTGSEYLSTVTIHTCHQCRGFSLHHGSEHETNKTREDEECLTDFNKK